MLSRVWHYFRSGEQHPVRAEDEEAPQPPSSRLPYFGLSVPLEASFQPEDSKDWYTNFFGQAYVVPHRDGKSVLVFPSNFRGEEASLGFVRDDDADPMNMVQYAATVYKHLKEDHPRLVKYLGTTSSGFRLERLTPGPMPSRFPHPSTSQPVLSLYWRWALHSLKALQFIHSKSVFLNDFCNETLWLREDFSLAIVGFLNATIDGVSQSESNWHTETFRRKSGIDDESVPSIKTDLFDWATWVWRLMTQGKEPMADEEGAPPLGPGFWRFQDGKAKNGDFPELAQEFLGKAVRRAWKEEYETAEEAVEDVIAAVQEAGGQVEGEDVLGFDWAHVFEVTWDENRHRQLGLRIPGEVRVS